MIIKCAIIDDEPLAIELLVSYVKKIPFMELHGKYSNAVDAMKGIADDPVELVFLDIQQRFLKGSFLVIEEDRDKVKKYLGLE